jgi:hypothetical protein
MSKIQGTFHVVESYEAFLGDVLDCVGFVVYAVALRRRVSPFISLLPCHCQPNNAAYSSSSSDRFLTKGQTGEGRENLAIRDAHSEIGEPQE